ncbi:hypothetical protein IWX90DRAFT_239204 [Phyllosticta citrichinensis]|uniref:BZIP transcription factor n=1 Tax=Phyllosticta citrichinensis TaxID=1130410 RepID=A0ABR1XQ12_9PEZI
MDVSDHSNNGQPQTAEPSPAPKRRRTSGAPSSRGVANLTPEQLARKRANDREAQRAIRERTKNEIENLKNRIKELESQQHINDLHNALRQKDLIQSENEDIRRRLATVMSIIQPILGNHGLNELAAAAERSPMQLPGTRTPQPIPIPDQRAFHPSVPTVPGPGPSTQGPSSSPSSQTSNGRNWPFPGAPRTSNVRAWTQQQPPYEQPRSNIHPDLEFAQSSDERLGVGFLVESRPKLSLGVQKENLSSGWDFNPEDRALEVCTFFPRTLHATCPLDNVLIDFLRDGNNQVAQGLPLKSVAGPPYPNFTALIHPERTAQSHPLSRVFTDILGTFPDLAGLPEKVAVLYIMFLYMRWHIESTEENYERLPDWLTPRPSQIFVPHPMWQDYVPWPRLRDRLISLQSNPHINPALDNFFIPYTASLSLNWPYDPRDVLIPAPSGSGSNGNSAAGLSVNTTASGIPVDPATEASPQPSSRPDAVSADGGLKGAAEQQPGGDGAPEGAASHQEYVLNPAFEAHLRNLENWTLTPAFESAFPSLAGYVKIKAD